MTGSNFHNIVTWKLQSQSNHQIDIKSIILSSESHPHYIQIPFIGNLEIWRLETGRYTLIVKLRHLRGLRTLPLVTKQAKYISLTWLQGLSSILPQLMSTICHWAYRCQIRFPGRRPNDLTDFANVRNQTAFHWIRPGFQRNGSNSGRQDVRRSHHASHSLGQIAIDAVRIADNRQCLGRGRTVPSIFDTKWLGQRAAQVKTKH